MLLDLPYDCVASLACMSVENGHHIILHESDSVFVIRGPTEAFVWHDMLEADNENIRRVLDIADLRQEPAFEIDLSVWLVSTHVPRAHCNLQEVDD